MSAGFWAGIVLGVCGLVSTLIGLYFGLTAWVLLQVARDKWLYFSPRWIPWRHIRRLAVSWVSKNKLVTKQSEIAGRRDIAFFYTVFGVALFSLASLVVGLTAIMQVGN